MVSKKCFVKSSVVFFKVADGAHGSALLDHGVSVSLVDIFVFRGLELSLQTH